MNSMGAVQHLQELRNKKTNLESTLDYYQIMMIEAIRKGDKNTELVMAKQLAEGREQLFDITRQIASVYN